MRPTMLERAMPIVKPRKSRKVLAPAAPAPLATAAEHYKAHEIDLYIETVSGKKFFIEHPEFDIKDIAHALGNQCRYTGHVKNFYSVAEHSVLVMNLCQDLKLADPFEGLMHDCSEAYLSDIAAPWKALLPDYKKLEAKVELPLRRFYGVPEKMTDGCKRADWLALFIEARWLMPTGAKDWIAPEGIKEQAAKLKYPIYGWSPLSSRWEFARAFNKLARPDQRIV